MYKRQVEDAAGAEVGGAGGPHRADGGGREEGDDGLGDVGEVAAHPVAGAYAEGAQLGGERPDLVAELGPGDGGGLVGLVDVEEGGVVGAGRVLGGAQGVLGVVEGGAGEPACAGHREVGEDLLVRGGEPDVEPVGDGLPEGVELVHGPAVQRGVAAVRGGAVALGGPGLEGGDAGRGDPVGPRGPEGFRFRLGGRGHGSAPGQVCGSRVVCVCVCVRACTYVRCRCAVGGCAAAHRDDAM